MQSCNFVDVFFIPQHSQKTLSVIATSERFVFLPFEVTTGVQKLPRPSPSETAVPARAQSSRAAVPRSFGERLSSLVPGGNGEKHLWLSKRPALPERAKNHPFPLLPLVLNKHRIFCTGLRGQGEESLVSLVRQAPHCLFTKGLVCLWSQHKRSKQPAV